MPILRLTKPQAAIIELMRRDEYATVSYGIRREYCPISATDPAERGYCLAKTIDSMRRLGYLTEIKPGVFRRNMECVWFKNPSMPIKLYVNPKSDVK